jgi:hypothetical protein
VVYIIASLAQAESPKERAAAGTARSGECIDRSRSRTQKSLGSAAAVAAPSNAVWSAVRLAEPTRMEPPRSTTQQDLACLQRRVAIRRCH